QDLIDGTVCREGSGEADHAGLGSRVVGVLGIGNMSIDGGDRDDPPALASLHQRHCRSSHMIHAAQIYIESMVPSIIVNLEQRLSRIDSGIVDKNIERGALPR